MHTKYNLRKDRMTPMNPDEAIQLLAVLSPPDIDFKTPKRFLNRELSWLQFNKRVLEEGLNPVHPLMERLRFLSISASNLDEFYMVRVAGLKAQVQSGAVSESPDSMTPKEQLAKIETAVAELREMTLECRQALQRDLNKVGIDFADPAQLNQEDLAWLDKKFQTEIFPVLSPLAVDPAHPFPFVPNLGYAMVLDLKETKGGESMIAIIILPGQLRRYVRLPDDSIRFISLFQVVRFYYNRLFPGYELLASGVFQVIRDSELEIDEKAADLVRTFQSAIKQRRRGNVVRLTVDDAMPQELVAFISSQLHAAGEDIVRARHVGLSDVKELVLDEPTGLSFPKYNARFPERIRDFGGDCFEAIRTKDILVHHPYESFDVVVWPIPWTGGASMMTRWSIRWRCFSLPGTRPRPRFSAGLCTCWRSIPTCRKRSRGKPRACWARHPILARSAG